ncbi:MAG: DUF308 domain-containing protein [Acidimicrobiales bacterium]|jgi:uncharacterized membrane protein HdeD (DUF308 family)
MASETEVVVLDGGLPSKVVWQLELVTGVITLVLGIILSFRPSQSLNVICVIIGILLIIGGIFHLIRALDRDERHRAWIVIAGVLELVIGVVLIRHLGLTKAAIGLLIGIVWIVQGVVVLLAGIMGGTKGSRGWAIAFGLISLAAGIVVVAVPEKSLTALALLLGIWFIVMGIFELIAGFVLRSYLKKADA